jgi:hypothetical protein
VVSEANLLLFRYKIQNREADKQCLPVYTSGPLLVFNSILGDGVQGIPADSPSLSLQWTKHYHTHPRCPEKVDELAPWVVERLSLFAQHSAK